MNILSQLNPAVCALLPLILVAVLLLLTRVQGGLRMLSSKPSQSRPQVQILTLRDVADVCGVSDRVVRRWIRQGLPTVHPSKGVILVRPKDLETFFEDHVTVTRGG